jgi:hypothetical protein
MFLLLAGLRLLVIVDTYIFCLFLVGVIYKACPSESGTEVGAPLFPAVELWISPVDGSMCQEKCGIHSTAAVCC